MSLFYLFTRYQFNWSEVEFSFFSTYNMAVHLIGKNVLELSTHRTFFTFLLFLFVQVQHSQWAYSLVYWNWTTHWSVQCPVCPKYSPVSCMHSQPSNGTCFLDPLRKLSVAHRTLQCDRWPRKLCAKKNWAKSIHCLASLSRLHRLPIHPCWQPSIRIRWQRCPVHSSWSEERWPFPAFVYSCKLCRHWHE